MSAQDLVDSILAELPPGANPFAAIATALHSLVFEYMGLSSAH